MTRRVLFYVQHLLGVGHLRRSEILAEAMASAGLDVTVALGGLPLAEVPFRAVDVAHLPAARIANEDFSTLLDTYGKPIDESWKSIRRDALLTLRRQLDPDLLLIELFPFGRRQFAFELLPLLKEARATPEKPAIACSVRDILVASKKPGRDADIAATARRFFDAVLVHGDPALIPFEATFPAAHTIADLIRYTGYVAADPPRSTTLEGSDEVIVSAGGGAVGAPLLFAALEARPLTSLRNHVWRLIAGPNLPAADFERLSQSASARTIVERFRADFPARLQTAALSISQAGYNTTMDLLRAGIAAVVVPYETPTETEQRLRSEILAKRDFLTIVPAGELSAERLARGIEEALGRPRSRHSINLSGAEATAGIAQALAERGRGAAP